jgi:hypothetical protein
MTTSLVQNGDYKFTADLVYGYIQILGESAPKNVLRKS